MKCQFSPEKVKVIRRQKPPQQSGIMFTYWQQIMCRRLRHRLQTRPKPLLCIIYSQHLSSATGRTAAYHVGTWRRHQKRFGATKGIGGLKIQRQPSPIALCHCRRNSKPGRCTGCLSLDADVADVGYANVYIRRSLVNPHKPGKRPLKRLWACVWVCPRRLTMWLHAVHRSSTGYQLT